MSWGSHTRVTIITMSSPPTLILHFWGLGTNSLVANRPRIEQCITALIKQGRFEEDETIVIRSHDMR
jgi:hypothetical protein